ncbi:hypothetical protein L4C36_14590 [Photobacterium japonica]|uniref:hypothetical protein n=1 Tax=Photobacterium japonica TaxID=2910235 RepID=UPI003D122C92
MSKKLDVDMMLTQVKFWSPITTNPQVPYRYINEYLEIFKLLKDDSENYHRIFESISEMKEMFDNEALDSEYRSFRAKQLRKEMYALLGEI